MRHKVFWHLCTKHQTISYAKLVRRSKEKLLEDRCIYSELQDRTGRMIEAVEDRYPADIGETPAI